MSVPAIADPALWDLFNLPTNLKGGLQSYLEGTVDRCAKWFEASGASLFLEGQQSGEYKPCVRVGSAISIPPEAAIVAGQGLAGACLELRTPLRVVDPESEPLLADRGVIRDQRISSALVIPLFDTSGDPLGVLCLSRANGIFPETALEAAAAIAGHVALAVSNAMLIDLERKHGEQLQEILDALPCLVAIIDDEGLVKIANGSESEAGGAQTWQLAFRDQPHVLQAAIGGWIRGELTPNPVVDHKAEREWTISMANLESGNRLLTIQESSDRYRADRRANKLENLANIGQMTAAIAHEVRNPLAAIRGAAQLARTADGFVNEMSHLIENEVDKLTQLCDEFLDFARPLTLTFDLVNLGNWADACLAKIKLGLKSNQDIRLQIDSDTMVMVDCRRLEQVVRNLVHNALQATTDGSPVVVVVSDKTITVTDQGKGMDPEVLSKLFTPFFTTRAAGTGLGLAVTKKILDAHGAKVLVSSELGKGSSFKVVFE